MKICRIYFITLLCMCFMADCGRKESGSEEAGISEVDWKVTSFAASGEVVEEQALWVEKYIPWTHEGLT
ncbi:MAG: hypothetical protein J1E01_03475 [Acetatifactor sp.]|nr:hypothetical protein [Acetatifactor sp.]